MKNSTLASIAVTILVHVLVIAAISHVILRPETPPEPKPVTAQLLPPAPVPAPPSSPEQTVDSKPARRAPSAAPKPARTVTEPAKPGSAAAAAPSPALPSVSAPDPVNQSKGGPSPAIPAAPVTTSAYISAEYAAQNRQPAYPKISEEYKDQGVVHLKVLVTAEGAAGQVVLRKSSGYKPLDQAAMDAVKTWRFNPATVDGKPISEWFNVPITFKLP